MTYVRRSLSRFKHVRYRAILHWRWEHTWNRFVETSTGSDSAAFSNLDPWKYTYVSYVSLPFSTPFPFQTCRSLFFFSFLVWRSFGEIKATGRGRKGMVNRVKLDGSRASSLLGKFDRSSEKGDRKKFSNRCTSFSFSLEE